MTYKDNSMKGSVPIPGTSSSPTDLKLPSGPDHERIARSKRALVIGLEVAIEKGRLQPHQAIEAAEHFSLPIPPWILRRDRYYAENRPQEK